MRGKRLSDILGFQQLIVDAVELAGYNSPNLKTELISILGRTYPSGLRPSTGQNAASLQTVLLMFEYARSEAARFSTLRSAQERLNTCITILIDYENCTLLRGKTKDN